MTSTVVQKGLTIDKFEMSLRLGHDNFVILDFIEDVLQMYATPGNGRYNGDNRYPHNRRISKRWMIYLVPDQRCVLHVETGAATDRNGRHHPYVKFSFNVQRLSLLPNARQRLLVVLSELSPTAGYTDLLEDGYVLYVEFSADFLGVEVDLIDIYHRTLDTSLYFPRDSVIETINLHDERPGRPEAFCMYDKKRADREKHWRIRRRPLLRIESKRRFNRTPTYQKLQLEGLHSIPNPFRELRIYDRQRIETTFTAARHRNFVTHVRQKGVQAALAGTRGADRIRRERMLEESCRVHWWNPETIWAGRHHAINTVLALLGGSLPQVANTP